VSTTHGTYWNVEVDQVLGVPADGALVHSQPVGQITDPAKASGLQDLQQGEHS
jgi:hypothetical protein